MISHYLQRNGIPTTTISLIREHTEYARQPRALWVPFPLGRPFGVADDPDFQRDVLRSALRLLETTTEPTIADYPHDAPDGGGEGVWACSVVLPEPEVSDLEAAAPRRSRLAQTVVRRSPGADAAARQSESAAQSPEEIDMVVSFIVAIG